MKRETFEKAFELNKKINELENTLKMLRSKNRTSVYLGKERFNDYPQLFMELKDDDTDMLIDRFQRKKEELERELEEL